MKHSLTAVLLAAALCAVGSVFVCSDAKADRPKWKSVSVHDPSIIRAEDGTYYIYGSHMTCAKSDDLMNWEMLSTDAHGGCTLVENVQEQMKEALSWAKTDTFWAPDVQQFADGRYYLYYCCCEGSSPLSAMGLAVSDSPEGPYEDLGIFLKSGASGYNATYYPNVIDPCTFFDKEGKLWMVYGSYSGGIFILEMDPETGFPVEGQGYGTKLLGKNHARIEGPYILYSPETDYYYLFLSFGGLDSNGGYNIRVCRSKNPDGPYEDALGQEMIKCGGKAGTFFNDPDYEGYAVKLMGGYHFGLLDTDTNRMSIAYRSPGHNSAIRDEETGKYYIVFHTRFAGSGESFSVRVHEMYFNEDGWPVVAPNRYAGAAPEGEYPVEGTWKLLMHEKDINAVEHESVVSVLKEDGTVEGDLNGTWEIPEDGTIHVTIDGTEYRGVLCVTWDGNLQDWTQCLTCLDESGAALWGIRAGEQGE